MEKKRILMIDDEINFTRLIKLNLEATGKYEVRIENEGILGLSAAKEFKPDLILLDMIMPDIMGGEVAEEIKSDDDVKDIPIVLLTAIATKEETESRGGIMGGYPTIAKPVTTDELINFIEENIRK
jgi:DNA-binding response OmpR family regulator